ncbi:MAG TPA: hypothetical protein VFA10_30915 [Ktedonobacteraceae bacterium]|nr:hypothetical protein [Ktedonobacteraceae bacterium]
MATTTTTATATTSHRRSRGIIFANGILTVATPRGENREETTNALAMTLRAYYIIGILMTHQQLKFSFAV